MEFTQAIRSLTRAGLVNNVTIQNEERFSSRDVLQALKKNLFSEKLLREKFPLG